MYNLIFVKIYLILILHKYTYINYVQIYNIHAQTYKCNRIIVYKQLTLEFTM